ncbi:MAG: Holliday junction resolvase RuvX [Bacteroidetes bacterium]|nr:Holliday junction resolvase RuvX [Bacteroidota bacterium]HNR19238.1 Holliday junction resolvase RuvX [Bacteroidia bacterium]HNU32863.1 Holliday junction resolvase RuvX [Bacteroidia bacterium]
MARILAIDYGNKRTGIAVTDPLQIIASALTTVHTKDLLDFLKDYVKREEVEIIVVGEPKQMNNQPSEVEKQITPFVKKLKSTFPQKQIERVDERFTSLMAQRSMIEMGLKKRERQNKATVDEISATIILQTYLENKKRFT